MLIKAEMVFAIKIDRKSRQIISLQWLWLEIMVITAAVFDVTSHDIHVSVLRVF